MAASENDDLYALLGLPEGSEIAWVQAAYEGAVASAAARQDWSRAQHLSAAFDRLPQAVRVAIYPGRDRDARRWEPTGESSHRARRIRDDHPGRIRWRVVFGSVFAVAVALLAGLGAGRHLSNAHNRVPPRTSLPTILAGPATRPSASPSHDARPNPAPARSSARAHIIRPAGDIRVGNTGQQIGGLPLWTSPPEVPVDSRGKATMRCAGPSAVGAWSKIDHRIAFTCPAGTAPEYRSTR